MTSEALGRSRYFGPPGSRRSWEIQVSTPVGKSCIWCEEEIVEGDMGTIDVGGSISHDECFLRQVVGSVAHQEHRCSCYGGTDGDDPNLTYRENARAALRHFRTNPENEKFH